MKEKIISDLLKKNNLDCFIIKDTVTIRYLTGFTGDSSLLFLDGIKQILITDGRYTEQAQKETQGVEIFLYQKGIWQAAGNFAKSFNRIGFDGKRFCYNDFLLLKNELLNKELVSVDLEDIRIIKTSQELKFLQKAADIADQAFIKLLNEIHVGATEMELAAKLEYYMRELGSEKVSFETIVASGNRSALPHGAASDKIIENGDFITFDFGATYKGYHSDITRTVVAGKATEWQKEIYKIVQDAQNFGVKNAKIGMTGQELDAMVRKQIADKGFEKNFIHGLGHGVGLRIHELPNINKLGDVPLQKNMVFSVEPGIYLPNRGGVRIEDTVVLTETGAVSLNKVDHQLTELF